MQPREKKKSKKNLREKKNETPTTRRGRKIALYATPNNIYAPSPATTGTLGGGCDGPVPCPCVGDGSFGFRDNGPGSRWGCVCVGGNVGAGCAIPGPEVGGRGGAGGGGGGGGGSGRTIRSRSRSRSPSIGFALGLAGTVLGIRGTLGGDIVLEPCPCIGCVASNSCGVLGWEWEWGGADGGVGEATRPGGARERTGEPCGVPPPPCWGVCGGGGGGCEGGWADSLNDPRDGRGGADGASGALKGVIIRSWGPAGGGPEAGLPRSLSLSLSR